MAVNQTAQEVPLTSWDALWRLAETKKEATTGVLTAHHHCPAAGRRTSIAL